MKIKKFFQPSALSTSTSSVFLLLRIVAGLAFIFHGWGKIQNPFAWMGPESPVPGVFQFLAALSEFGGGIAWILGFLTFLSSFGMACTMIVATYFHMIMRQDPFVASGPGQGSYELAAIYLVISLLFMVAGPGKFSVDKFIFGEKK